MVKKNNTVGMETRPPASDCEFWSSPWPPSRVVVLSGDAGQMLKTLPTNYSDTKGSNWLPALYCVAMGCDIW